MCTEPLQHIVSCAVHSTHSYQYPASEQVQSSSSSSEFQLIKFQQ